MNERYTRLRAAVDDAVKRGNIGGDYRTYDVGSLLCDHDALAARLAECEAKLHEIGDYAHEHSAGPTVPDHLWTVREMAYGALGATDSASLTQENKE